MFSSRTLLGAQLLVVTGGGAAAEVAFSRARQAPCSGLLGCFYWGSAMERHPLNWSRAFKLPLRLCPLFPVVSLRPQNYKVLNFRAADSNKPATPCALLTPAMLYVPGPAAPTSVSIGQPREARTSSLNIRRLQWWRHLAPEARCVSCWTGGEQQARQCSLGASLVFKPAAQR